MCRRCRVQQVHVQRALPGLASGCCALSGEGISDEGNARWRELLASVLCRLLVWYGLTRVDDQPVMPYDRTVNLDLKLTNTT
jgi:hypothetical protein